MVKRETPHPSEASGPEGCLTWPFWDVIDVGGSEETNRQGCREATSQKAAPQRPAVNSLVTSLSNELSLLKDGQLHWIFSPTVSYDYQIWKNSWLWS